MGFGMLLTLIAILALGVIARTFASQGLGYALTGVAWIAWVLMFVGAWVVSASNVGSPAVSVLVGVAPIALVLLWCVAAARVCWELLGAQTAQPRLKLPAPSGSTLSTPGRAKEGMAHPA